jgi:PAS domain-containing protein
MFIWEIISLIISASVSFAILYLKVPQESRQQMIALLLLALLIFVTRFVFSNIGGVSPKKFYRVFTLLLSSLMAQMLVLSSGGFYSPFLILIHLFTVGVSFIFNTTVAMTFLTLSAGLLFAEIKLDPTISAIFAKDIWSAILYFISFLVIVPISFLVARSYHLKDSLSKILTEHIQMGKLREESILSGLNELVFVTDLNLQILYVNSQAERELGVSSNVVLKQNIFSVLALKDSAGNPATAQALSVDQALTDKATRIVNDFYFYGKRRYKVTVQIKPIVDLSGKVIQVVFVITDAKLSNNTYQSHSNLDQAHHKYNAMFDDIRKTLLLNQSQELVAKIELLHKIEEDMLIATEIEDHPIKEASRLQDIALLCKQIVVTKRNFARSLKVPIIFYLPDNESESSFLSLVESNLTKSLIPISDFVVPGDFKWLQVMIDKILDICLLLSMSEPKPEIKVSLKRDQTSVYIEIKANSNLINEQNQKELFIEQFGDLGNNSGLRFGSGLEGYIIKMIKEQLDLPLETKIHHNPQSLAFNLTLSKKPH